MGKSKFFKNTTQAKRDLPVVLKNAAIRSGAAVAASIGDSMLRAKLPASIAKFTGPLLLVGGMVGEAFIAEEHLNKAAQGISTYGAIRTALDFAPASLKAHMSLTIASPAVAGIGDVNWNALSAQAETATASQNVNGLGQDENPDLSGMGDIEDYL